MESDALRLAHVQGRPALSVLLNFKYQTSYRLSESYTISFTISWILIPDVAGEMDFDNHSENMDQDIPAFNARFSSFLRSASSIAACKVSLSSEPVSAFLRLPVELGSALKTSAMFLGGH